MSQNLSLRSSQSLTHIDSRCNKTEDTNPRSASAEYTLISISNVDPTPHISEIMHGEQFRSHIHKTGHCPNKVDAEEYAVLRSLVPQLKSLGVPVHDAYCPWKRDDDNEDNVLGIDHTIPVPVLSWLTHAVRVLRSALPSGVKDHFLQIARRLGAGAQLRLRVLAYDINLSDEPVRQEVARYLVLLFLILEKGHNSYRLLHFLQNDCEQVGMFLWQALQSSSVTGSRTSDLQLVSLLQELYMYCGGTPSLPSKLCAEYTVMQNAEFLAKLLKVNQLVSVTAENFDWSTISHNLVRSSVWEPETIAMEGLQDRAMRLIELLNIGFPKGYLGLPRQLLQDLSVQQVQEFEVRMSHFSNPERIPTSLASEDSILLLLANCSTMGVAEVQIVREWSTSKDGEQIPRRAYQIIRHHRSKEQLILAIAAAMWYWEFFPPPLEVVNEPRHGSWLADLHAILEGQLLDDRMAAVFGNMAHSLIRVLTSDEHDQDVHPDWLPFLVGPSELSQPVQHVFDGITDQYMSERVKGHSHDVIHKFSGLKSPAFEALAELDWTIIEESS